MLLPLESLPPSDPEEPVISFNTETHEIIASVSYETPSYIRAGNAVATYALPLVTTVSDGLMSKEDKIKLNDLD